ncbi:class I SAM-dependent methyltransferase [Streptomyces sp. NPDC001732]
MGWTGPGLVESVLRRVPDQAIRLEAGFLSAALRLRGSARVLDVGCGLGRHARLLAARGHRVLACERDAYTAEQAGAELRRNPQPGVEIRHAAVEDLPSGLDLDGAYALMAPLGVDTVRNDDEAFLRAVRSVLPPTPGSSSTTPTASRCSAGWRTLPSRNSPTAAGS